MSRRTLALAVLVVAASLAGCSALSDDGGSPSGDADAITSDAADEMAAAESYRLSGTIEQTISANNQEQTATVSSTAVFDRTDRTFRIERSTNTAGQVVETASYLLNGTLYERNPNYERAYGSAWVKLDVADRLTETWRAQDTLTRQRILLENATVSYEGTETVNGTETDVIAVDGDEAAFEDLVERRVGGVGSSANVTVEEVSFTHYVSTETDRLRRATGTLEMELASGQQSLSQTQEFDLTFSDYGAGVDVTLPDGASVAVAVGNETG